MVKNKKTKEIQLNPTIADNDLDIKINKAKAWIKKGHRVKISMRFRGRENLHKEAGLSKIKKTIDALIACGAVISSPLKNEENTSVVILEGKQKNARVDQQQSQPA